MNSKDSNVCSQVLDWQSYSNNVCLTSSLYAYCTVEMNSTDAKDNTAKMHWNVDGLRGWACRTNLAYEKCCSVGCWLTSIVWGNRAHDVMASSISPPSKCHRTHIFQVCSRALYPHSGLLRSINDASYVHWGWCQDKRCLPYQDESWTCPSSVMCFISPACCTWDNLANAKFRKLKVQDAMRWKTCTNLQQCTAVERAMQQNLSVPRFH